MKNTHFTKQERDVILWIRFLTAAFFVAGLVMAVSPNYFLEYLDGIGAVFFNFSNAHLESPRHEIWWALTIAFMAAMTYACFAAQCDWLRNRNLVPVMIVGSFFSFLGLLSLVIFYPVHFFYIVGCIVDGVICAITWYAYAQATHSRTD